MSYERKSDNGCLITVILIFMTIYIGMVRSRIENLEIRVEVLERLNEEVLRPKAVYENPPRDDRKGEYAPR